ncbi:unnamed protein product [Hydatigera taeniaeformis]|uniref:Copine domain-containing protein n=1 Tax=Hydatigena taeniaeformis TaxID=6205 RepID=A0A0R3WJF1_HYDTA|nr:unnamed protein product [Hydatigera taeniaeformis]
MSAFMKRYGKFHRVLFPYRWPITSVRQVSVTLHLFSPFRVLGKQTAPDNSKRDASAAADDDDPFYLCDYKTSAEISPASTTITYRISYKPRQLHLIDWLRRLAQGCFHGVSTALSGADDKEFTTLITLFANQRHQSRSLQVPVICVGLGDACFTYPVFQIAADMVGQGGHKLWQNEVQSSIFEHAAQLRMTDVYEELYNSRYANSMN